MSDPTDENGTPQSEEPVAPSSAPAESSPNPRPGAQAASRARRIGGRPMPGPRLGADEPAVAPAAKAVKESDPAELAPAKAEKAARAKAEKPPREPADAQTLERRVAAAGTALAVLAGLAAAAMLGIGIWLSHGVWWAKTSTTAHRVDERTQVLAAAKTCTAAILSYDYRTIDTFEKAGQACATGQLKSDYTKLMDETVKQIAPQTKTVQVFQVAKAGVASVSPDGTQWVVLIYGQEAVTSTSTTPGTPRLDLSTASVTLNKVGKTWLVSNMSTAS